MLKKAISKGDIKTVEKLLDNGEYCRNTYIFLKAKFKYLMSIKAIFLFILNTLVFALFFMQRHGCGDQAWFWLESTYVCCQHGKL